MMRTTTLIAITVAAATATLYSEDPIIQKAMWESFKTEHGKSYQTMQIEAQRFHSFVENTRIADLRNEIERRAGGSAVHGITKFSDLSQSEFETSYLLADPSLKSGAADVAVISTPVNVNAGLIDWTGRLTTPVKDQGYCGSCWAFSAVEQIESDAMRQLGSSYLLSPQQVVSCDHTSLGCRGGWTESAYTYVKLEGGLSQDSNYPYTSYQGVTGTCKSDKSTEVISVSGFTTIKDETQMAAYVQSTGPLSICIDANNWNSYSGGIMAACGTSVDHCVQAVGVDASEGGYWKVRNSWGTGWGESGFIRLAYGANTCAITNDPTFVAATKA